MGGVHGYSLFGKLKRIHVIIFSFLTKIILDDWKWFISRRPKIISSGPFMANWEQSPLFMGNTKGFVLFTSNQNDFHHWWLFIIIFQGIKNYLHGHGQLQNNLHQSWAIENDLHHWCTIIIYSQMIEINFHCPWQSKSDLHHPWAIENNPHCWCFLITKNDLHHWFIFTWTNKNNFSPFMGNWK